MDCDGWWVCGGVVGGGCVGCLIGRGRFETCPYVRLVGAAVRPGCPRSAGEMSEGLRGRVVSLPRLPHLPSPRIPRSLRSRPFRWAKGAGGWRFAILVLVWLGVVLNLCTCFLLIELIAEVGGDAVA